MKNENFIILVVFQFKPMKLIGGGLALGMYINIDEIAKLFIKFSTPQFILVIFEEKGKCKICFLVLLLNQFPPSKLYP